MKILLAISGKRLSDRTFAAAQRYLESSPDARLIVLHVSRGRTSFYQKSELGKIRLVPAPQRIVIARLKETVDAHFAPWPGRVKFRLEVGDPGPTICRVAVEEGADLIIVGGHTSGKIAEPPIGGVTRTVIHHAPADVLVVR